MTRGKPPSDPTQEARHRAEYTRRRARQVWSGRLFALGSLLVLVLLIALRTRSPVGSSILVIGWFVALGGMMLFASVNRRCPRCDARLSRAWDQDRCPGCGLPFTGP